MLLTPTKLTEGLVGMDLLQKAFLKADATELLTT